MAFERVYSVTDYFDGPRSGVAEFFGQPHRYQCKFDEKLDDWSESFLLTPISSDILALELEQWALWRKWELAFHRGDVPQNSHPGLGGTDARYDELKSIIKDRSAEESPATWRAKGLFRARPSQPETPMGVMRELEVEWTDAERLPSDDR
jgi:hypothetical protein